MANVVRVFLSSSFQDMHAERDYLKKNAFAALRSELFARGLTLQVMDLRGTTTDPGLSQEEAVLRLCLQGVDECVPRMVALLGDRYGWIPYGDGAQHESEDAALRAAAAVEAIGQSPALRIETDEMAGRSVTHLEIYYGFKQMDKRHMLFYRRQGLPYAEMPERWVEAFQTGAERQRALVEEIRAAMGEHPENLKEYPAGWDFEADTVTGLEALNGMVYRDLKQSLADLMPEDEEDNTPYSHEFYVEEAEATLPKNEEGYFIFPQHIQDIVNWALDDSETFHYIHANEGGGITAAMAQVYRGLLGFEEEGEIFTLPMAVETMGSRPTRDDIINEALATLIYWLKENGAPEDAAFGQAAWERVEAACRELDETDDAGAWAQLSEAFDDERLRLFCGALARTAAHIRVVLVISGLHHLIDGEPTLGWMSRLPTQNVAVIFSGRGRLLTPYMEPVRHWLPLMWDRATEDAGYRRARVMLAQFAAEYGKSFDADVLHRAAQAVTAGDSTPLYARVLADYLMNMTGEDYLAYTGPDAHLQFMHAALDALPATTGGLYGLLVRRAIAEYGSLVQNALGLMTAGRAPVPGHIFAKALSLAEGREVEDLELYSLRGYFNAHLSRSRHEIYWGFAHPQMRDAVGSGYTPEQLRRLARCMYTALADQTDYSNFSREEWLYYAWLADEPNGLHDFLDSYYGDARHWQAASGFMHYAEDKPELYPWLVQAVKAFPRDERCNLMFLTAIPTYFTFLNPHEKAAADAKIKAQAQLLPLLQERLDGIAADEKLLAGFREQLYAFESNYLTTQWNTTDPDARQPVADAMWSLADRWEALQPDDDVHYKAIGLRFTILWDELVEAGLRSDRECGKALAALLDYLEGLGEKRRRQLTQENRVNWRSNLVRLPEPACLPAHVAPYGGRVEALLREAIGAMLAAPGGAEKKAAPLLEYYKALYTLLAEQHRDDEDFEPLSQAVYWGEQALPHSYADADYFASYSIVLKKHYSHCFVAQDHKATYATGWRRVNLLTQRYNNGMMTAGEYFSERTLDTLFALRQLAAEEKMGPEEIEKCDRYLQHYLDHVYGALEDKLLANLLYTYWYGSYAWLRNREKSPADNSDAWGFLLGLSDAMKLACQPGGPLAEGRGLGELEPPYDIFAQHILKDLALVINLWMCYDGDSEAMVKDGLALLEGIWAAYGMQSEEYGLGDMYVLFFLMAEEYRKGRLAALEKPWPGKYYDDEGRLHPVAFRDIALDLKGCRTPYMVVLRGLEDSEIPLMVALREGQAELEEEIARVEALQAQAEGWGL